MHGLKLACPWWECTISRHDVIRRVQIQELHAVEFGAGELEDWVRKRSYSFADVSLRGCTSVFLAKKETGLEGPVSG
jgi:hypothetical protein